MLCPSRHWDAAQCDRGEEEWIDSAVAGERDAGDGGSEVGDSGSKRRWLERVCWGEAESGREPLKVMGHGEEGGSV